MATGCGTVVQDADVDTIGGYRLVRLLGFGARAEVYLGHAGTNPDGTVRIAAVKLYRPGVDRHSIDTELEALGRVDSPHLLRLRDVATDHSGMPCAILQRLGADNLAHILIARDLLAAGEAVTILAPLVRAVAQLHRVGVAHGAVRLSNVLFDEAGAPVLTGFGAATLIGAPATGAEHSLTAAELSNNGAALRDLKDVALLCKRVLDRTRHTGSGTDSLAQVLEGIGNPGLDARAAPEELADRLFELADPLPVTLSAQSDVDSTRPTMSRVSAVSRQAVLSRQAGSHQVPGPSPAEPSSDRRTRGRHHALHRRTPEAVKAAETAGTAETAETAGWAATAARGRRGPASWVARVNPARLRAFRFRRVQLRRPFWVAGAVGVAVLVGALAMIPPEASSRAVVPPSPSASVVKASSPTPAHIFGDDPVEATRQLLQARAGCLAGRSADCLGGVDQEGSAALDHDVQLITSGAGDPPDPLFPIAAAALIERLGDGALVSLTLPEGETGPVSVLVIRTGNGWRIRDVLIG